MPESTSSLSSTSAGAVASPPKVTPAATGAPPAAVSRSASRPASATTSPGLGAVSGALSRATISARSVVSTAYTRSLVSLRPRKSSRSATTSSGRVGRPLTGSCRTSRSTTRPAATSGLVSRVRLPDDRPRRLARSVRDCGPWITSSRNTGRAVLGAERQASMADRCELTPSTLR